MSDTFNCPNCGAPLDYKGSDPIIRCPYCSSSVIVPDNLRSKPAFSSQPGNFTLGGIGDMGALINQARRFKEIKDLAQSGNLDEAARIYSEVTGASLEDSRKSVDALAHGVPVTLTGMSASEVRSAVQASQPSISISGLGAPAAAKGNRSLGCMIGCFVTVLVLFILGITLVPTLGGLAGLAAGLNPQVALTVLPNIPDLPAISLSPAAPSGFASQDFSIGGEGTGPGLFGDVRAIAVVPDTGAFFAANYDDGRVQAFDPQGKFITQWIVEGKNTYIQDMVADRNGNVFIAVLGKLLVYNAQGKLLNTIEPPDSFDHYEDIALLADGSLVAISRGEDIVQLSSEGEALAKYEAAVSTVSGDPELSSKVAVDGLGNIFVLGTFNNAVFVFDSKGKFLNRFGSDGDEPGQFQAPSAIAVDGKGRIYISDVKGVQVFSNDGRYIDVIKVQWFAYGLSFDDQGKLYITTNQKKVEKYTIPQ